MNYKEPFIAHQLDPENILWEGGLPASILGDSVLFDSLWDLHPADFHDIKMMGRDVKTPRWQQAYEKDYKYTGGKNTAMPCPLALQPFLDWAKQTVDSRLNGLLVNWYDGALDHYIGKHRDAPGGLIDGAAIVTISLGDTRTFRMRPWKGKGMIDFEALNGKVFILPFSTNQTWTHEVPKTRKFRGRRISVTIRAFE